MLQDRHLQLLHKLVDEYIATARPVGSFCLQDQLGNEVSSATIRNMLRQLEEEGFLYQPHTSAGRVPTDKGYRSYVDTLHVRQLKEAQIRKIAEKLSVLAEKYHNRALATAKLMAALSSTIAVSGWLENNEIYEAGFTRVLDQPEREHNPTVREVYSILDDIEQYVSELADGTSGVNVYIGKENRVIPAVHTSVIAQTIESADGQLVVLMLIGPKRMPYRRNLSLLNTMAGIVKNY